MVIFIQDETIEVENNTVNVKTILETINTILIRNKTKLEYLIIDGQPIYSDFNNYFSENLATIEKIEVVIQEHGNVIQDTILLTNQYLDRAIPQINVLAEEFYQEPNEKTWIKLMDLFEGIQWILESVVKIDGINGLDKMIANYLVWNEYVQTISELNGIIPELEVAMTSKDHVLIGDILLHEIIPVFKEMEDSLKFLVIHGRDKIVS